MTELADLIDLDAERLELGAGYEFTEGPAWSVGEQALIFSDIPDCGTPTSFCIALASAWSFSSNLGGPTRSSSFCITLPSTELLTGSRTEASVVTLARVSISDSGWARLAAAISSRL